MRVIAGKYKGRALFTLPDRKVRPTTDRVKEALFNLIGHETVDKAALDLFAGSGSLGIECLSRGASEAVFVDKSREAAGIIRQNLDKIGISAEILNCDYKSALNKLSAAGRKFGVIMIDPPYRDKLEDEILQTIVQKDVLEASGIIVLERLRENSSYILPQGLALYDTRDYGGSSIDIIRNASQAAVTGTFDPFTNGHRYLVEKALETFDLVHIVFLVNPDKTANFDLKKRMRFAELSTRDLGKRVKVSYYPGLAIDYCKRNGIRHIIRGYRNGVDLDYENRMAEFNLKNGGIETIILPAKDGNVSSSLVKAAIKEEKNIGEFVSPAVADEIMSEGRRWKT